MLKKLKSKFSGFFESEAEEKEKLELETENLLNFIENENTSFQTEFTKKRKSVIEDLREKKNKLNENLRKLNDSQVNPEAIPRLKKAVKTNKKELVNKMKKFSKRMDIPENLNYERSLKFSEELLEDLEDLNKKTNRNLMFVNKLLKEQGRELNKNLKEIEDKTRNFKNFLENNRTKFMLKNWIKDSLKKLENYEKELERVKERKEEIRSEIKERKNKVKEKKEELEKFKKGKTKKKMENLKNKMEKTKEKIEKIETHILKEFSGLRKAFKKYKHQSNLPTTEETFLEMYIHSPLKGLRKDKSLSYLKGFLEETEKFVRRGALDLDEKRLEKFKDRITEIKNGVLEEKMKKRKKLSKRIENLKNEVEGLKFEEKLKKRKVEIKRVRDDLRKLEEEIKEKVEREREVEEKINLEKSKIEEKMEKVFEREVEIN